MHTHTHPDVRMDVKGRESPVHSLSPPIHFFPANQGTRQVTFQAHTRFSYPQDHCCPVKVYTRTEKNLQNTKTQNSKIKKNVSVSWRYSRLIPSNPNLNNQKTKLTIIFTFLKKAKYRKDVEDSYMGKSRVYRMFTSIWKEDASHKTIILIYGTFWYF